MQAEAHGRDLDVAIAAECRRITDSKPAPLTAKQTSDTAQALLAIFNDLPPADSDPKGGDLITWLRAEVSKVLVSDLVPCAEFIRDTFPTLWKRGLCYSDRAAWQFAIERFIYSRNDNCPDCGGRIIGSAEGGSECTDCDHHVDE
jgi:hypothetical protein